MVTLIPELRTRYEEMERNISIMRGRVLQTEALENSRDFTNDVWKLLQDIVASSVIESIKDWSVSRDGTPEADDTALRTISDICDGVMDSDQHIPIDESGEPNERKTP